MKRFTFLSIGGICIFGSVSVIALAVIIGDGLMPKMLLALGLTVFGVWIMSSAGEDDPTIESLTAQGDDEQSAPQDADPSHPSKLKKATRLFALTALVYGLVHSVIPLVMFVQRELNFDNQSHVAMVGKVAASFILALVCFIVSLNDTLIVHSNRWSIRILSTLVVVSVSFLLVMFGMFAIALLAVALLAPNQQ